MRIKIANQLLIKKKLNIILDQEILPAGPIFKKKIIVVFHTKKHVKHYRTVLEKLQHFDEIQTVFIFRSNL